MGIARLQAAFQRMPRARKGRQQVAQRMLAAAARRHDVAAFEKIHKEYNV